MGVGPQGHEGQLARLRGGGEAVETAWKLAKNYFKITGKQYKHKVISRAIAYHGTPQGALSITGIPPLKEMFEPLVPGAHKVPNTNFYRRPEFVGDDEKAFGRWAADRIAAMAPGDLNRVFFTTGGGEAVESAWKLAKQYFKLTGKPNKHKVISRAVAYHGTPQGALSITGLPAAKEMFEPLVPGAHKVPNTNMYRAPEHLQGDEKAFGRWAADRIAEAIEFEGPDTVAAVFLEPVQNSGGCFPPPAGYFERVREICDEYDVLLVSDEVICSFGRIGSMFACDDFGYVPDIITCAKGMTSGYSPIGAMIASDRLFEPFKSGTTYFPHGYTFGGHPVSAAVAMANLDIFEREGLVDHVHQNAPKFRSTLEKLLDLPIVGDVRGAGFFYGIELVKDKETRETFDDAESERLLRGYLSKALFDAGLYCRADDRGDPVIQLAPPLIIGQPEFDDIESRLRSVLTGAEKHL